MADNRNDYNPVSGNMPDVYDRTLDNLMTLQGVDKTRPTTTRTTPTFGIGGSTSYIVQTFRIAGDVVEEDLDKGTIKRKPATFVVALEVAQGDVLRRIVLPHDVLDVILRQRDSLTTTAMRRSARASAQARRDRGIVPDLSKARAALKRKRKK